MLPFYNTKTLLCIYNELLNRVDIPNISLLPESTLNAKYDLFPTELPTQQPLKIKYYGIGINGFEILASQNATTPYKPEPTNMDLYFPIPFRCVPVSDDLSDIDRALYRMRVKRTFGGIDYWCYYLKVIEYLSSEVELTKIDLETGIEDQIVLDYNNLSPTPVSIVTPGMIDNTNEYNSFVNTKTEILGSEIIEVINILYNGDLAKATVSELGLYSGEDLSVNVEGVDYIESIYTQMMTHHCFNGIDMSNPSASIIKNVRIIESTGFIL